MKRLLPWIVALAQLALLLFMAGQREWVARTGQVVMLRTAPIDPNDPMRGDYVRLEYEISEVASDKCRDGVATWFDESTIYSREKRDARVYAALRVDEFGLGELVTLSDRPPADGLYLSGRVDSFSLSTVRVRYGIEAMFMQQGEALKFENAMRNEKRGVPVNARVAISDGGLAVLTGSAWEPLGLQITVLTSEPPTNLSEEERRTFRRRAIGAEVVLKNHSDAPLAIVDRPDGRSFRLLRADRWEPGRYSPVEMPPTSLPAPEAKNIIVLQPGATHVMRVDFTRPEWFVMKDGVAGEAPGEPISLETHIDNWNAWFRIEYAAPTKDVCAGLPNAEFIWHRRLRSRAFNPAGGGVD